MIRHFSEEKNNLDIILSKIEVLYAGDVISSEIKKKKKEIDSEFISNQFLIEVISDVYNFSIKSMAENSESIVISSSKINDKRPFFDILKQLNINTKYLFCNQSSKKLFGNEFLTGPIYSGSAFPDYFFKIDTILGLGYEIYYSPHIKDSGDDLVIYSVDSGIQSLLYSLHNMDYNITNYNGRFIHTISYNIYKCDYKSYKLIIRDVEKLRDKKIEQIFK